jgi:signal peptidase I
MERPDAAPPAAVTGSEPPAPHRARSTWVRDLLEILLVAVVLYALIWTCIETVRVDGDSMQNTLQSGDFLIASKISYVLGNPARGDIVILDPPHLCGDTSDDYIKRVVGLPGDNIEIDARTTPAELLVQPGGTGPWTRVEEPYLPNSWEQGPEFPSVGGVNPVDQVLHIPSGDYFVMGDNRNESCDSRFFGLVPRHRILAKAILRIWPLTSFGGLGAGPTLVTTATPTAAPSAGSAGLLLALPPLGARRRRVLARISRLSAEGPPES